MCANPAKFQVLFLVLKVNSSLCLNTDGQEVKQSEHVKVVGFEIDKKLHFDASRIAHLSSRHVHHHHIIFDQETLSATI